MFEVKIEELKRKIIDEGIKQNLIKKDDAQIQEDEYILNYAKNHGFGEYVLLQSINHAKFTIVMRDKTGKSKEPLIYGNQIADDIIHLWMRGVPEDKILEYLREAVDNGQTYVRTKDQEYNLVLESIFDRPVESGGLHGLAANIKDMILDYKQKVDAAEKEDEKQKLRLELLTMICGFYEVEI